MSVRAIRALLLALPGLLLLSVQTAAQGFAGLGTEADDFARPERDRVLEFPADHGAHPDFRIEWWYLTANMTGPDGTPYGLQWTLFRSALAPRGGQGWDTPQLWMGHAAVTTPEAHFVTERLARGGIGQAGVQADPFRAWIDDWAMEGPDFDRLRVAASGPDFAYDVQLSATGPLVLHGDDGYSVKSAAGQASHYYSQPFFDLSGVLRLPTGEVAVTGAAWLDREWSSQPLAEDQDGWDWFSLSFGSGDKLMGFILRGDTDFTAGTWITAEGTTIALPDRQLDVTVAALNSDAWMDTSVPYWEGPVTISGSHQGVGYLEMTGYDD